MARIYQRGIFNINSIEACIEFLARLQASLAPSLSKRSRAAKQIQMAGVKRLRAPKGKRPKTRRNPTAYHNPDEICYHQLQRYVRQHDWLDILCTNMIFY
jgi:hypothetical protein